MNEGPPKRRSILHIFALWAIAVAQPVLDLLGNNATFFVAHRASRLWIVVFALVVVFAVPLLLVLLVRVVAVWGRAADVLHLAIVAGLVAAIIVPPVGRALRLGAPLGTALFLVIGLAAAWAYRRLEPVRRLMTILAVAPLFVLVAFLFFSQSRDLVFAEGGSSDGGAKEKVDVPVVVLGLDELALGSILRPDGTIDATRFPNFARLAKLSTWYPNATTVAQTTEYAFPAILTGKRPSGERKLPIAEQHPDNLFSLLEGSMPMHATEFVTDICPGSACGDDGSSGERLVFADMLKDAGVVYLHYALPADVAERSLPALTGRWSGFSDGKDTDRRAGRKAHRKRIESEMESSQRERFERARDEISASEAPALWYIHLGLPHAPWRYLASGQQYNGEKLPGVEDHEAWNHQYQLVEHGLQRYLLQLSFADKIVGDLLDRLEETELLDESLLMVFADHGVAFGPGNRRLLDGKNTAEIISVPLFIKYPGQKEGAVDDGNVETVDILPTLADVVGVEIPWKVDGVSLRNGAPDRASKSVIAHRKERTLTFPPVIPKIDEAARRIERLFGRGGSRYDVFAWGPHRDLVGSEARASTTADVAIEPVDIEQYADVDPGSTFVPARFNAVLEGVDWEEPRWIAVALNGRIAGLGQTFISDEDTTQLTVMLAPSLFDRGANEVDVYLIGPGSRLTALT